MGDELDLMGDAISKIKMSKVLKVTLIVELKNKTKNKVNKDLGGPDDQCTDGITQDLVGVNQEVLGVVPIIKIITSVIITQLTTMII